jgi:hypothetical protein
MVSRAQREAGYEDVAGVEKNGNHGNRSNRPISARELLAIELPPVAWAIPDILPAGVSLLAGKPKLGKSWLALSVCEAIAVGGVALGVKHVEKGETLYLALEDNRRRLQQRLNKLLEGRPAPEGIVCAYGVAAHRRGRGRCA